ncbi:MAG: GDP-L-fucose synthase family protein [Sporichthyaceae bacterium]
MTTVSAPRSTAEEPARASTFHHRIPLDAPFHIAGHRGLVGSAVWRHLAARGHTNLLGKSSAELDLRERDAVFDYYAKVRPHYVVLAAAKVGGIGANSAFPADFLSDNLRIQVNVLDAAHAVGVKRLLFLGSSCIYPKFAEQPIREESLLTGLLEPTNDAYAVAKIAGILHVQALRRQHGCSFISAMPTNLYGPGDNFGLETSHVLPAMIRKFHDAKVAGAPSVALWGTGTPRREFLHVDDLAIACLLLMERYESPDPINVGTGADITIRELAERVCAAVSFGGKLEWDATRPDGTPRKLLDVRRIQSYGWSPKVGLQEGIESTYASARAEGSLS